MKKVIKSVKECVKEFVMTQIALHAASFEENDKKKNLHSIYWKCLGVRYEMTPSEVIYSLSVYKWYQNI